MSKSNCTYRFTGKDGKEQTIQGMAAMKAFLADGGLELFYPDGKFPWLKTEAANVASPAVIQDFGEKIGGARKDTAASTGKKGKARTNEDDRPAWARRFQVSQIVRAGGQINEVKDEGRWVIRDKRSLDWMKQPKLVSRTTYATQEEAEAAVPLAAVAQKHRAVPVRQGDGTGYEIWRDVTDRKRVKVVDQVFDNREDAMRYMAENAQAIIETNTTFGEADLPRPPSDQRIGEARRVGDVKDSAFTDEFGFRGVEFGNWNNQDERQNLLNDAYDGLLDLADVMGIPPRAISLNGELALAFGARGQGLAGARAHYELDKSVINLTKMNGAGSLAHEWFHALDHYFGRQDGKASAEWVTGKDGTRSFNVSPDTGSSMVTSGTRGARSGMRAEMREAYANLMDTIKYKAEGYVEDTAKAEKFVANVRNEVQQQLDGIRRYLADQMDPRYYKRNNKPASAEQLAEFDTIAEKIVAGESLELVLSTNEKARSVLSGMRWTNDALNQINAIMKSVRGRQGFGSDGNGTLDRLRTSMGHYSSRLKMLADAQNGSEKTRKVPTQFAMDAKELDQGRGTDYWTTPHELGARAFQGFVEDKIAERGGQSPFLNYGPENVGIPTPWGYKRPYPEGNERKAINAALEKLVATIQTKETDKGVALFSVAPESAPAASVEVTPSAGAITQVELDSVIKGALNGWKAVGGDMIATVQSVADLPAEIVQGAKDQGLDLSKVEGVQHRGKVYLVRDNLRGTEHAARVLFHEVLGHLGVKGALSGKTKEVMRVLWANIGGLKGVEAMARKIDAGDGKTVWDRLQPYTKGGALTLDRQAIIMDELIAYIAQGNDKRPLTRFKGYLSNLKADVVALLRKLKLNTLADRLSKAGAELDVLALVRDARAAIETGKTRDGKSFTFTVSKPEQAQAIESEPRFSVASSSAPASWASPTESAFDNLIYKMQDKHIDAKRVVESITKTVGAIKDSLNVYLQEELFHGRAAKRVADFGARELTPMLNQMRMANLSMDEVEEFLHARHAKEANAVIAQRNPGDPGMQDGGSGMTNAEADAYFAKLPAAQRAKLEAVAKRVDAIIADTRKLYVSYGLEDQAVVDGWTSMFKHYIPLMRENKDGGMGIGQGFSVKGKEVKGRTGSKRKVVDIVANIAAQREKVIVRGEKNRVSQALVGLAWANPNKGFWEVRSQAPTERVFDEKSGKVVDRPDPMFKSRDNVVGAKVKDSKGNVTEQFVVFNEDDPRAMRMAAAMKNLDAGNLEGLLGVSAKITRYFSAINTQYNPVFGVVNVVRDVQGAMVNLAATPLAGQQAKIAKDTMSALAGIYGDIRKTRKGGQATSQWAQLWEQMQEDGGTTGYRDLFKTSADRAESLKAIINPDAWMDSKWGKVFTADGKLKVPMSVAKEKAGALFDWLSDYNEAMENGVRLAAYKAALDKGMSREQAASLSKNLTVNFNRKGQAGQQAGAVYAFFNAAMQGTARIGQTLFDMDGGDIKTLRLSKVGKTVVYGGVLLGAMQAMMLAAAGFSPEDPPEFLRERSLIIPTPVQVNGKWYVSIPMPLGLHVIPGLGRHAVEFALSGFNKPADRVVSVVGMFMDAFNPIGNAGLSLQTIAPTAIDPLVALAENRDAFGNTIARRSSNPALPGHTQWKDTATVISKVIAEGINWISGGNEYVAGAFSPTPDQIDYLLAQVGGGVAREVSKVMQTAETAATGQELPTYKIPLLGRFVGNAEGQASQGSAFYANLNKLNELETEIKGLRKDGRFEEAAQLMRDRPEASLIAMANKAERDVQALRRDKRELIAKDASREEVRAKEDQITAVMSRLNEMTKQRMEAAQ